MKRMATITDNLIGVGIYTPAEADRLTGVAAQKIRRWLRGHSQKDKEYQPLWQPQINIGDDEVYLGFRDLTEVRVVDAFVKAGLSPQKIRRAIQIARDKYSIDRPLSTRAFRTDGKDVFLMLSEEKEEEDRIVDVFRDQYAIRRVLEPSFKGLEFNDAGEPTQWHIAKGIILDPEHSFGQPVDKDSFVPTKVLAAAVHAEGSARAAAAAFQVPLRAVNQALAFEQSVAMQKAA